MDSGECLVASGWQMAIRLQPEYSLANMSTDTSEYRISKKEPQNVEGKESSVLEERLPRFVVSSFGLL
jgi:hypothetical protein